MKSDVKRVMSQVFGLPIDWITDEATADNIEGWNSLAHLNLVLALEDEFKIRFSDNQIATLVSCQAITDAIEKTKHGKKLT